MSALLDEILANPRATALRLVYADQLVERGDPRGELIQLACAPGRRTPERDARLAELREVLVKAWRARGLDIGFDRGFIRSVRGPAAAIIAAHDDLAREPITALAAIPADPLAPLLALPLLARVETLELGYPLADPGAALLAAASLPALRSLQIAPGTLAVAGARALGAAAWLPQLRQLLVFGASPRLHVELFASARNVTALEIVSAPLASNAADIVRCMPALQSLKLCLNQLGPQVTALATVPLPRLANLELRHQELREPGVRALSEATAWPMLRRLSISSNAVGDDGIIALADAPLCRTLVELDIGDNALTARGIRALGTSPHLARLKYLDLRYTARSEDLVHAIIDGFPGLERIGVNLTRGEYLLLGLHPRLQPQISANVFRTRLLDDLGRAFLARAKDPACRRIQIAETFTLGPHLESLTISTTVATRQIALAVNVDGTATYTVQDPAGRVVVVEELRLDADPAAVVTAYWDACRRPATRADVRAAWAALATSGHPAT